MGTPCLLKPYGIAAQIIFQKKWKELIINIKVFAFYSALKSKFIPIRAFSLLGSILDALGSHRHVLFVCIPNYLEIIPWLEIIFNAVCRPNRTWFLLKLLYRDRHITYFFQLLLISWMVTLDSYLIWQIINFILPPNEYGCVYAWTTLRYVGLPSTYGRSRFWQNKNHLFK